ncbi:MAG TPA: mannose-1-phosphate guanylyltransferase, partial [Candidatus Binataceae bacterium]|nr:mannose-1-phosphate guanylyltransferase [Candidatus Binataceae bacterium]
MTQSGKSTAKRRTGEASAKAFALIIAGGRGTRFWPASREHRPKPLFSIDEGTTLLSETIARLQPLIPRERIFVLVTASQRKAFASAIAGLIPPANLILEPDARGTTVAIAYGAAVIRGRCGDGAIAVMPADHYITPASGFRSTLAAAIALASSEDAVVVIGVKPTRPETGYGYQEIGSSIGKGYRVKRFVEKPKSAAARKMLASKRYLWNAGMFVMTTATIELELIRNCPALAGVAKKLTVLKAAALAKAYGQLDFDSFDRVVIEHSSNVLGVKADFDWYDVGTWEGLWEAMGGRGKNVTVGRVLTLDSEGVLAHSSSRLMVLLGVKDIVIVDTPDAIL